MRGYIFDANHVSALCSKNERLLTKVANLASGSRIFASAVTIGELWAGNKMTENARPGKRNDYIACITKHFLSNTLPVTSSTSYYYAEIMGRIWQMNPPKGKGVKTDAHLAQLSVDVNDIWLVAAAHEHNLTVVTDDKMTILRQSVPEVTFESWT